MSSQGPNSPATAVNDTSFGSRAWANVNNVFSSDNVRSSASNFPPMTTNYLKVTNFGFSIPSGATIDGIEATIERRSNPAGALDTRVRIVKGGTISTTDNSSANAWTTSDVVRTYGSSSYLWGETWTDTDINSSTFGLACASVHSVFSKGGHVNEIDHITITVYYTAGGGGGGSVSKFGLLGVG